ncbi:MAG: hypothetical protein J6Q05_00610 [Elusimicrobiaceae bacterium]|nr:hypothetical protein [Elusimicrobiaceae bacterium]
MKKADQQIQANLQRAIRIASGFSVRTVYIIRVTVLFLLILWVAGALYFHYQVKQDEQRIEQNRIEESRRQEFMRRGAQYQQDLQQRTQTPRVRNVFDGR